MAITDSTREKLNMIEIEEEPALPEVTNGDGYLNMDNDAHCYEEDGKFDDEIIEEIVSKRICIDECPEDDDFDDGFIQPMITHTVARQCVQTLQRYFIEQGFTHATNDALDICAEEVYNKSLTSKKQSTIDTFFPN